ncbi:hypothetical protein SBRY_20562 [Actinacidiphila bryophytorum]|uniref:Uncharacterized protein n=1 Tax=Actinacidiphila bryophytorum TaxID=1436133 RepID=A0A9W4E4W2_9ACTN|nr:hypothetical protein SBRY_20562 [Actinacidiphila bryophytorum]
MPSMRPASAVLSGSSARKITPKTTAMTLRLSKGRIPRSVGAALPRDLRKRGRFGTAASEHCGRRSRWPRHVSVSLPPGAGPGLLSRLSAPLEDPGSMSTVRRRATPLLLPTSVRDARPGQISAPALFLHHGSRFGAGAVMPRRGRFPGSRNVVPGSIPAVTTS